VSTRPLPGHTTNAAHTEHGLNGLQLRNPWAAGEENPWASADWNASWKRGVVTQAQWQSLCQRLSEAAKSWQLAVSQRTDWNEMAAAGALASAAHTAYHLGAIRQIIAASGPKS
jgi:hypothetical protein